MSKTLELVCETLGMPYITPRAITGDLFDLGIEQDCSFVGEVDPLTITEIVRSRTSAWVAKIDVEINKLIGGYTGGQELENGEIYHPHIDPEILRSRFISFAEYQSLFSYTTSYEKHLSYITFRAVNELIKNAPNFTSEYSNTLTGYIDFLARYSPPLRDVFLKKALAYIPNSSRKRHTYVTGGSGSGKSELLKILAYSSIRKNAKNRNNQRKRETVIVIDPHGDLAEQIGKFREHDNGADLIYVDPRLRNSYSPSINPFDVETDDQFFIELLTQEITGAFNEIMDNSNLSTQMMAMLNPCIATIIRKKNGSIKDLQRFMDDDNNSDLVALGRQSPNPAHRDFFSSGFLKSTYKVTKGSVYTRLQTLLNSTVFSNFMARPSTIQLDREMDAGKTIIFNLSQGKIGEDVSHSTGRLLLAMIKAIGLRRENVPEHLRMTTHVIIDECQNFISPSIEKILAEARKYAIHLTLAQQILGQGMEASTRRIVLGNTAVKITGANSLDTLQTMAKETGAELEIMQKLKVGQFAVKVRDPKKPTPSFVLEVPPLLLNGKNDCSDWNDVLHRQLGSYYSSTAQKPREQQVEQMERQAVRGDLSPSDGKSQPTRAKKGKKAKYEL